MSKVALNVAMEFEPAVREDILRALVAHRERCLAGEPGTLQFEVLVPLEDPGRLFLFELYTDDAALAAHSGGTSIATYREEVKGKLKGVQVHRCALRQG